MNYQKIGIGLTALAVMILAGAGIASAAEVTTRGGHGPGIDSEKRTQISDAIESGDYETFRELIGERGRLADVINEENFSQFAQIHQLMEEGKTEEAQALRIELGLDNMRGRMPKMDGEMTRGPGHIGGHGDRVCDSSDSE